MFKLPSVKSLIEISEKTFFRFPFVLLSACLGTILTVYSVDLPHDSQTMETYIRGELTCALGISLFLVLTLLSERKQWKPLLHYGSQITGVIVLLAYFYFLPHKNSLISLTRFFLFAVGLHLLVSFSVFFGKNTLNAFWQFNKTLFLRILFSALYSGSLYLGLVLAIAAIDKLFELNFQPFVYAKLWFCMVGIVNTWFFLGGVPENVQELEHDNSFPKGLKVFTQYVLLPLVTVYLTILYCYMAKIVIQGHLPVGWVSNLVIGFSVAGIFSLLLIHPIQNLEGNNWIRTYSKWFYLALFPMIILLFIAIGKRVSEYGITENRYFIIVIALWLLGIAIYFSISKAKNIKVIPISLCCIAFLTSFGPWGAFSISERSQMSRLETLLTSNGILVNGKIHKLPQKINFPTTKKISSIIEFLYERKRLEVLQPWIEPADVSVTNSNSSSESQVMAVMGLKYVNRWDDGRDNQQNFYYQVETTTGQVTPISGYDYYIKADIPSKISRYDNKPSSDKANSDKDSINAVYSINDKKLNIVVLGDTILGFDVRKIVKDINAKNYHGNFTPEEMTFYAQGNNVSAKMILNRISGNEDDSILVIDNIQADIFLKNH